MSRPRQPARTLPRLVVGAKSVTRALDRAQVRRVLVAADVPAEKTDPVRRAAAARGLDVLCVGSAVELGNRCGIGRPVAAAAELAHPLLRTAQELATASR